MFKLFNRKLVEVPTPEKFEKFEPWPKTLHVDKVMGNVIVTEKIDGTNACIVFQDDGYMFTQSRNRIITPDQDNQGFAKWAYRNQKNLFYIFGPGRHYGEWWGKKIGRTYNMQHNVFSVFNNGRFYRTDGNDMDSMSTRAQEGPLFDQVSAVPLIYTGVYGSEQMVEKVFEFETGKSKAAAEFGVEFYDPEGVCYYFRNFDRVAKLVFAHPGKHKWEVK